MSLYKEYSISYNKSR